MSVEVPPTAHSAPARPRARKQFRSAHELRLRRRRFISYALLAGACILMVNAVIGENGYVATLRAQREYADLSARVAAEHQQIEALRTRIHRLRNDPAALEEEARRQLGLIRPGETLVIIRDVRGAADSVKK